MTVAQRAPVPRTDIDAMDRALDRAAGKPAIPGNAVAQLVDGPGYFPAIEATIAQARRWLHFENYIIRDDRTGKRFAELLIAAAQRGVKVRVLYDVLGCRHTGGSYWRALRSGGVEVRGFNSVNPLFPRRSMQRNHSKLVSADGVRAVLGGFCIGDEWTGDPARRQQPWRDTGIDVRGPAVPALDLTFARVWKKAGGELPDPVPVDPVEQPGNATVRVFEGLPRRHRVERAVHFLVAGAAERLWITDAYFVAPAPLYAALVSAARDGVDVRVLVPGRTDIPVVRAMTRVGYRQLLEAGVRIFEWAGPMLHAKTVVVDQALAKIGSSNMNSSSFATNYELDVLVESPELANAGATQFRRDLEQAVEVVLRPRRLPARPAWRLPPAVVVSGIRPTVTGHAPAWRERSRRAVVSLRSVASAARRTLAGATVFTLVGAGVFALAAPQILAYVVATVCFVLGGSAAWNFVQRQSFRDD